MLLERAGTPLRLTELPTPEPGPDELRLDVAACAVCRTDLHVVDAELTQPKLPCWSSATRLSDASAQSVRVLTLAPGSSRKIPFWSSGAWAFVELTR